MNRRERLMATLHGRPVDRPPVNFYEISGFEDTREADPYNIYSHPSWRPLLELARERSDVIYMTGAQLRNWPANPVDDLTTRTTREEGGSKYTIREIKAGGRTLRQVSRQDQDVNTSWTIEHFLKDVEDFKAWLNLPEPDFDGEGVVDVSSFIECETRIGESGIVMIDTGDPLCAVASLFDMGVFTVIAMTEPELFHRALERVARSIMYHVSAVSKALPGRLWRIYGPEYASPPYLPPTLFMEYAIRYDTPMVLTIQRHGGFARIHSHGRLKEVLDSIAATGCVGLDPIEPPPQGDMDLRSVREKVGKQMVLFGNLEASDLENLSEHEFRKKVDTALREGAGGDGRGFVLMPSACPYGRILSRKALRNYEVMVESV